MFVEVKDYSLEYRQKGGLDSEGWKWIDSVIFVPSLPTWKIYKEEPSDQIIHQPTLLVVHNEEARRK